MSVPRLPLFSHGSRPGDSSSPRSPKEDVAFSDLTDPSKNPVLSPRSLQGRARSSSLSHHGCFKNLDAARDDLLKSSELSCDPSEIAELIETFGITFEQVVLALSREMNQYEGKEVDLFKGETAAQSLFVYFARASLSAFIIRFAAIAELDKYETSALLEVDRSLSLIPDCFKEVVSPLVKAASKRSEAHCNALFYNLLFEKMIVPTLDKGKDKASFQNLFTLALSPLTHYFTS